MRALHNFECKSCADVFEQFLDIEVMEVSCRSCGEKATKTFAGCGFRKQLDFPAGEWHGLAEVNGHAPDIRTRRQLREALKRQAGDELTESYAVYDDGYMGY